MSFSKSSIVPMGRKRTITLTEHVTENGDPLVVKKKARVAASATKKTTQVFFFFYPKKKHLLYDVRKQQLKMLPKIVSSLGNPFLKRLCASLSSQMEAKMTRTNRSLLNMNPAAIPATKSNPRKLKTPEMMHPVRVLRLSSVSAQFCYKIKLTIILERLFNDWNSLVYVFFKPTPSIEYINERRVHVFECSAKHCKGKGNGRMVRRYLDTSDAKSTL
jgi:hypothetical protein